MKFKIIYVEEKVFGGYVGMNYFAAKEKKIYFPYSQNTILIWNGLSTDAKRHTILHEKYEIYQMKNKNKKYKKAHREALIVEKF